MESALSSCRSAHKARISSFHLCVSPVVDGEQLPADDDDVEGIIAVADVFLAADDGESLGLLLLWPCCCNLWTHTATYVKYKEMNSENKLNFIGFHTNNCNTHDLQQLMVVNLLSGCYGVALLL